MVQRMATAVARGGILVLVGHRPIGPAEERSSLRNGRTEALATEMRGQQGLRG